ncbi:MAG: GAF domain-containing protein [Anaerolineales bacterium]|nr:GAF domain-containing protein [Anaerolineales bacterium]
MKYLPDNWFLLLLILFFSSAALALLVRRRLKMRLMLESQVTELEALSRVGRALVEAELDTTALCELVYEQAGAIIDTSTFQVGLFEEDRYHIIVWVLDGERQAPAIFDISDGRGVVSWVAKNKSPLLIHDYQAEWETLPAHPRYLSDEPPRAAVFIPLVTGDESIGILGAQSFTAGAFSQDDVRRLSIVANQAASAISNARLYRQAQTRAVQLELVNQISSQVRALMPLDTLFEQTVNLIQKTFGYYCVSIYIYNVDQGRVNLEASTVEEVARISPFIPPGQGLINWAVAHRETVMVNNVSADPRYIELSVLPATLSEIVVPLVIDDKALGALDVQSDKMNTFGSADRYALEALAGQIALAIQESRLYFAERKQRSVAEILREVAQTLTSSLELETVLPAILKALRRVLAYDAAAILLLESNDMVVVQAVQGSPDLIAKKGGRFNYNESTRLLELAKSDQPIIFQYDNGGICNQNLHDFPQGHVCLGAPLVAQNELIGFLTVDALPPHTFQQEDANVIATFAGHAAVAINNARLYASQKEQAWVSTALLRVAEATSRSTELDGVLDIVVHMTMMLVGIDRCGILLWNSEFNNFRGTKLASTSVDLAEEFARLCLRVEDWPPLSTLKEKQHPIILGGGEALSDLPDNLFDFFGLDEWLLLLPLVGKGELMGVMLVSGETSDVDLVRSRIHLIGGIASQAALGIENARLYMAQQEEAYVTIVLLQVAEAVNSLTELNEILSTVVRLAPMLAGIEQSMVLLWTDLYGSTILGAEYGFSKSQLDRLFGSLNAAPVKCLLDAFQVARDPVAAGPNYELSFPDEWREVFNSEGVLAVPLITRRGPVGSMLISLPADGTPVSMRRQSILTGIAHQASTAIENDQLYQDAVERERMQRELEVAQEIQSSFLPGTRPEEEGWSVGTFWQAARQVGGDFFDFFQITKPNSGKRWGIVIADVADKGVPAALYMALSRTLIRTIGHSRDDPGSCLERVNELLLTDSRSDLFVTVIYAIWDPQDGVLMYANAGHNPPLCLRNDGAVEVLDDNDIVLGVLPDVTMRNHQLVLDEGDVMILYTDGITDALDEQQQEFGLDRLQATACAAKHKSAMGIVQDIRDAVADFVGETPQFDDLTLVVLKREN